MAFRQYRRQLGRFSYNARLYLVHILGMELIHGTSSVLFNLYLLAVGFQLPFIALRLTIDSLAYSLVAVPAGIVADRLGRKWSIILGDFVLASLTLVNIFTVNPWILLSTPVVGAFFGSLHWVTEPAFMAENSDPEERLHLFSVGGALGSFASMTGALLAGAIPTVLLALGPTVALYRWATLIGIVLRYLSLLPAWLLVELPDAAPASEQPQSARRVSALMPLQLRNPAAIVRLVLVAALAEAGGGFIVSLFNIYFHSGLKVSDAFIGGTFALGGALLAGGTLLAPLVEARWGRVSGLVITRAAAIPCLLVLAWVPRLGSGANWLPFLAALAFVGRQVFWNLGAPLFSALSMEALDRTERATFEGIRRLVTNALSAGAVWLGAMLMNRGNFSTPFLLAGLFSLASLVVLWRLFPEPRSVAAHLAVGGGE